MNASYTLEIPALAAHYQCNIRGGVFAGDAIEELLRAREPREEARCPGFTVYV
jgi:hypothetical protein